MPWLACLVYKGKDQCINLAKPLGVNEGTLIATLILLSFSGIEAFLLLCRWEMFTSWVSYFKMRRERLEFISIDAHRRSLPYELPSLGNAPSSVRSPTTSDFVSTKGPLTIVSPVSPSEKLDEVEMIYPEQQTRVPNFSSPNVRSSDAIRFSPGGEEVRRNFSRPGTGSAATQTHEKAFGDV